MSLYLKALEELSNQRASRYALPLFPFSFGNEKNNDLNSIRVPLHQYILGRWEDRKVVIRTHRGHEVISKCIPRQETEGRYGELREAMDHLVEDIREAAAKPKPRKSPFTFLLALLF